MSATSLVRILLVALPALVLLLSSQRLEGQQPAPAVHMVGDTGEAAKYWARWRGPSGQGLVTGTGYPDSWSSTENV